MKRIFVHGLGAVSPAGWGLPALSTALERGQQIPAQTLKRPGRDVPLQVCQSPAPSPRPAFFTHPRLRRSNAISQYTVAAALEAIGPDATLVQNGSLRLGIIVCLMAGCVAYSRRFYEETLRDPATASPLIFPETVFNAPGSHLAAYLNASGASYTIIGDEGSFLQGLALAADWLTRDRADACVVVGAEEIDWLVSDALWLFQRRAVHSDGAGAIYLKASDSAAGFAELTAVTDSFPFADKQNRKQAAHRMRTQLPTANGNGAELLCLGTQNLPRADAAEKEAWQDWPGARLAPKELLGQAFTASSAWQCVLACEQLRAGKFTAANVSVVGANQQAIGARFVTSKTA